MLNISNKITSKQVSHNEYSLEDILSYLIDKKIIDEVDLKAYILNKKVMDKLVESENSNDMKFKVNEYFGYGITKDGNMFSVDKNGINDLRDI